MMELLGYYPGIVRMRGQIYDIGCLKDIAASKAAFAALQENDFIRYENLSLETRGGQCVDVEFVSTVYPVRTTRRSSSVISARTSQER